MKHKNFYVIENALLNVGKNKGRNMLLGVMIFAIIATTVVAMAIYNTSGTLIGEYKTRFGSEVSISPEKQKIGDNSLERITAEQTLAFSQSEYLSSTDMYSSLVCHSDTLTAIDQNEKKNSGTISGRESFGGDITTATMRLRGDYYQDFTGGKLRKLSSGEMPEANNECIVSEEFAELNRLNVGDTITLTAGLYDADKEGTDVEISLSVVGIYIDVTEEYPSAMHVAYQNRRNEILTTFDTVVNVQHSGLSGIAIDATYYLKSPELLKDFASEIRSKGLPAGYKVDTDKASYDRMVAPVEGLKSISLTFLLIVLVLGAAIMILLSVIAIRERKYEIGVLRAMGLKKNMLALGLWVEIITITCICFVFGMILGGLLSQPISDMLLAGQAQSTSSSVLSAGAQPLTSINISISPLTTLQIFGVATLLASIAGIISVSRITKYEPIKILMERN